jgi:uroporphyrinogen III methyltransferase/synthase
MTRTRKTVGRISFVGAGPGDPGLLTQRALEALRAADHIIYDPGIPDALLAWITADVRGAMVVEAAAAHAEAAGPAASEPGEAFGTGRTGTAGELGARRDSAELPGARRECDVVAEFSPAEGVPGDVAKVLLSGARSGLRAVHLVAGDPFEHDSVVKEVQAVARTAVPFEVVPGVSGPAAVATYAGVALTGVRTTVDVDDVQSVDFEAMARAVPHGLALAVDAGDLAQLRDGLLAAGLDGTTAVAVTGDGTGDTQYTAKSTVDSFVAAALGFAGRVVLSLGPGLVNRDKLGWWENRPLYGWKVLVPRTKEQAGAMSERLRAYGAMPCEVPTIAVEPPRTPAQMERAIKGLVDGRYAWTIFTSVNAVRAVWEKFAEHGLDARHFGGVKIACIGEATADAVRSFGIQPELVPPGEQSSEGLLAEFSPHDEILDPVGRVLLPRADIATETLAAGLTERGWEVDDVTAYRTVRAAPPPADIRDAIKSGGFDAVLFTSSSTVRNLVGIAGKPHARTVVAVIGPKTADTAVEFGLRVDVQPPHSSVPDLVEALAAYAVELREKLAAMPAKQRRGSKVQGPTALRFR